MKNPVYFCVLRQFAGLMPLLAWLLVWGGAPTRLEAAYNYPIGIPTAWTDPDVARPARPVSWASEVPGYYYVDWANGTDVGRTWGSPGAARKTIPLTLGAGTYCEVAGTYSPSREWIDVKGAGTAGAWVANTSGPAWLVGLDGNNRASLDSQLFLYGRYLCCEYLDNLAGNKRVQFSSASTSGGYEAKYMLLRNCEFVGTRSNSRTSVPVESNSVLDTTDIVIYKNHIHTSGPETPANIDEDGDCIMIGDTCKRIYVLDNELHDVSGAGIGCATHSAGPSQTSRIFLGRNHIYNTWGVGIGIKTTDHVVISQNTCHSIKWTSWTGAKCIGGQYNLNSLWIIFNHCYAGDLGIKIGSTSGPDPVNIHVIGNVVHDIYTAVNDPSPDGDTGYSGAITLWGGAKRHIVGNTIYNCHNGIALPGADSSEVAIENNIIANCLYHQIRIDDSGLTAIIRNNLLYQSGGAASIAFGDANYTTSTANALSNIDGLIEGDPLFVNVGTSTETRNLAVQASSPAKDVGLVDTKLTFDVYAAYLAEFGVPINVDFADSARPAGMGWDIGAYEVFSIQTKNISTPSGLRIIQKN